jgi:hypothetical protein
MIEHADFIPFYPDFDSNTFQQQIFNKEEFHELKLGASQEAPYRGYLNHQRIIQRYLAATSPYNECLLFHEMGTGKTFAAIAVAQGLKTAYKKTHVFAKSKDLLRSFASNVSIDEASFFRFHTFLTFARELQLQSDPQVEEKYSDCVFIIDEVHNINGTDVDAIVYKQFKRLFHLAKHRKCVLMSGSPMRDDVSEFSNVMNLILPEKEQMPPVETFMQEEKDGSLAFIPGREQEFKKYLRGRVSFLKAAESDIPVIYKGEGDIPQFREEKVQMSPFQSDAYRRAITRDTEDQGIYANSRQASLFVFPDGSWGQEGFNRYKSSLEQFRDPGLYSVKYSRVLEILSAVRGNVYIYCSVVQGSGIVLLSAILRLNGYKRCKGTEKTKGKRFILLTGQSQGINALINYYNRDENAQGEYCQVVLGSRKISEGFTFKNVQRIILLTFHWNANETAQAVRRGIRYNSHAALERLGVPINVIVDPLVAVSEGDDESIDERMIRYSLKKDLSMKRVEQLCQEVAFDCPLNLARNPGQKCDTSLSTRSEEEYVTYELYYSSYMDLVPAIARLFRTHDQLSYTTIFDMTRPRDHLALLKALAFIISNNIHIQNRFDFPCFLREQDNKYILTYDPFSVRPVLCVTGVPVERILTDNLANAALDAFISAPPKTDQEFAAFVNSLPVSVQHIVFETACELFMASSPPPPTPQTLLAINYIRPKFNPRGNIKCMYILDNDVRCFKQVSEGQFEWSTDCEIEQVDEAKSRYVGIESAKKFCLKDTTASGNVDKRKNSSGAVCVEAGWRKDRLQQIALEMNPAARVQYMTKADLCKLIRAHLASKNLVFPGKCGTSRKRRP